MIERSLHVARAVAFFLTSLALVALTCSSPVQAGNIKGQPTEQIPRTGSPTLDSASLVHLLDSLIIPGLKEYHIPGMAIAIVRDSNVVLARGYGYADVDRNIPFDPESTVIRIASVSKLFTGTAVMQLVERGLLDMHQDINTYLTRFTVEEAFGMPVTLHHLLTHTAGFDERSIGKSARTQESQIPLGDFLATRLPRRICKPGEVYTYSNFSNALAGFVVEEAAHQEYASYVRTNILKPLGMGRSDYRLRPDLLPLLAQSYSHDGDALRHQPFDFINDYPGGQMLSTAADMAKFMIAHLRSGRYGGNRILNEESVRTMHTVRFTHHKELEHAAGYSFGILPARSQTILMHDGGYTGVGSRLCLIPEIGVGFFVACNIMDGALLDLVSRELLDRFIPEPPDDTTRYPLTVLPPYDRDIAGFAGTYRHTRYSHTTFEKVGVLVGMTGPEMTIGRDDGGMILMNTFSGTPRRMVQIQPGLFRSIDDRYFCAFRRDESGSVTHLFTNGTTAFEKIAWYETVTFQRSLCGLCLLVFVAVSVALPILRKRRKTAVRSGLDVDPVRWFSEKTASMFLYYVLGLGIVMGLVIPKEELELGFAHGMHWTAYAVQTIALLAILFLAGLGGLLFWKFVGRSDTAPGQRVRSAGLGLVTAVAGTCFVWFLWYWNMVGYQF
jgi:CubicO group peptidase (beta-lactamase class C family)